MKKLFKKIHDFLLNTARKIYYKHLRRRLKVKSPTIIASNCIGSLIYHHLGLRFDSPTINLFITKSDFIVFVQNLKEFLDAELIEVKEKKVSYPVGKLEYNGKSVQIDFMHYKSFEDAKNKWNERKARVDYSKIFIIQMIAGGVTEEDIHNFDNLPYKHKMLITNKNLTGSKHVVVHEMFNRKDYYPGQILEYKPGFSVKKYMDDIDYVKFLNEGKND